jgi:hypothetical protein
MHEAVVGAAQVARLIRRLTAANPAERPAAREVLRGELLPPTVGDQQLADLLRALPDNAETFERVVDAIFAMPAEPLGTNEVAGTPNDVGVGNHQTLKLPRLPLDLSHRAEQLTCTLKDTMLGALQCCLL